MGNWTRPTADTVRWEQGNIVFESVAQYDQNDMYIGRQPRLVVGGAEQSFDDAVSFAEGLGHGSKWVRGTVNRSHGDTSIQ